MCNEKGIDSEELPRDELIVKVLRYLVTHPMAKDTINGIQKCWLSKSTSGEGKRKLEETCDLLVTKGWLIARRSPQSETIYSLNENGLSEINAFLNDES
jgi:hypothetical protein